MSQKDKETYLKGYNDGVDRTHNKIIMMLCNWNCQNNDKIRITINTVINRIEDMYPEKGEVDV